MSDLNQIHTALNRLFNEEGQRIVFWNDPDQEFFMTVPLLELDGVKVNYAKFGDLLAESKAITGGKEEE